MIHYWPENNFKWTDKKVTFCLSFDCDNKEDEDAFPCLMDILGYHNIKSSFAVCGQRVEESPDAYRLLIKSGHEIMNHGYSKHSQAFPDGKVLSTLFYNDLDEKKIFDEIRNNHHIVKDVLGYDMVGFRTPHFGTFQKREQILLIHSILKRVGYLYDSSALMITAKGLNLLNASNFIEFPLTSIVGLPDSVFDSWGFLKAADRARRDGDFVKYFKMMIDVALKSRRPILLNIYLDPSHIINFEGFKITLDYLDMASDYIFNDTYRNLLIK
ncbi:polysaccharide deacetylase family protein [bacterium]|nr:polysaccharide deacetylase family protein [bacterium]